MNEVAIIIPVHNSGRYLQIALDCILNRTSHPFKIILIESESTDGTDELCDFYSRDYDNIEVYHTKKEGLIKAINFGIEAAGDLDVYITQDDVLHPRLFERDWLTEMVTLSEIKDCGAVISINAGGISGESYIDGMHWAGTWSLYLPRKTIKQIGLFDENFSPGMGDDIDYSYRIQREGLKIYVANFWVDHHRKTEHPIESNNEQSEQLKEAHSMYFKTKWSLK